MKAVEDKRKAEIAEQFLDKVDKLLTLAEVSVERYIEVNAKQQERMDMREVKNDRFEDMARLIGMAEKAETLKDEEIKSGVKTLIKTMIKETATSRKVE
jgi:hypothetical protein